MNVADQFAGGRLEIGFCFGTLGGGRVDGGFIVEAVQVAAGRLEFFDPFLGLASGDSKRSAYRYWMDCWETGGRGNSYLGNHHVAVKGAPAVTLCRSLNVLPDLGDDGRAEGKVWDEVAIPGGG
jgi:hypothetical protein